MSSSRRVFLMGAGVGGIAAGAGVASASASPVKPTPTGNDADQAWLQSTLERYDGFGIKASGGPGDQATGAWLEDTLKGWGYTCRRQPFDVPWFDVRTATLSSGDAEALVIPQAIVAATGPKGVTGPLRLASDHGDLSGAIALIVLPYKRWAAFGDPQVARPLADAFARGALAAVLVTTGPTGEAIALNVSTHKPPIARPVAILAPKSARPFLAAAEQGHSATLIVDGQGGQRSAYNLIAHLDRKSPKTVIVSTPRSGWFHCAAERGSGLAVWLSLARWLARTNHGVNIELLATSGHEYEYLGGEHYLTRLRRRRSPSSGCISAPALRPATGRNSARRFNPLPSADSQRVLTATADVVSSVRAAFHGVTGLEATYVADQTTAGGELVNVLNAGYKTAIGLYGGHRYFHTQSDDMRCVSGDWWSPWRRRSARRSRPASASRGSAMRDGPQIDHGHGRKVEQAVDDDARPEIAARQ